MGSFEVVAVDAAETECLVPVLRDAEEGDDRIRAVLADPGCTAYAARADGRLIGAAVVRWETPQAAGEPAEIVYIAVDAEQRGHGHGRAILAALAEAVRARPQHAPAGAVATTGRRLVVGTANCSLDNIAFYQRCGFRMLTVHRDFFAYIEPPIVEHGIPMRDMIVFSLDV